MKEMTGIADFSALKWYVDAGISDILGDTPRDRTKQPEPVPSKIIEIPQAAGVSVSLLGKSESLEEAVKIAKSANTLEELSKSVREFEGIGAKKTAGRFVFSSGNPKSKVMVIGDVPSDEEERQGFPFAGDHGLLMDKAFSCIGLDRNEENSEKGIYMTNLMNWRLPGNRTPTESELQVSLPFLERHIQLVSPEILVLCGGQVAKSLLGVQENINKLRNKWHDYNVLTQGLREGQEKKVPAIVVYHPIFLLQNPIQKKAMWKDLLEIAGKVNKTLK